MSVLKETFFAKTRLAVGQVMEFLYFWLLRTQQKAINTAMGLSKRTITNFVGYAQQLVIEDINETQEVIGGPGIIVEVDESKFSRRKYNRGHRVASKKWVFGGVERTPEQKFFAVTVNDRSASTLEAVIAAFIHPESTIYSDCWKGYSNLAAKHLCASHQTVNHSENYVNPVDGTCTNMIECKWNVLKQNIPRRKRTDNMLDECLLEEVWRHQNKNDLWGALLRALKTVKYPDEVEEQDENTNMQTVE